MRWCILSAVISCFQRYCYKDTFHIKRSTMGDIICAITRNTQNNNTYCGLVNIFLIFFIVFVWIYIYIPKHYNDTLKGWKKYTHPQLTLSFIQNLKKWKLVSMKKERLWLMKEAMSWSQNKHKLGFKLQEKYYYQQNPYHSNSSKFGLNS